MQKLFNVNTVITLVVIVCIQKCTSDSTTIQVDYLWQARHWQDMEWFEEINIGDNLGFRSKEELWTMPDLSAGFKLEIIPLLMGCSYGQKLIDFLLLTTSAVAECKVLSVDGVAYARDCWQNLGDSILKGSHTILTLLRTFMQIRSLGSQPDIAAIPFHDKLLEIHSFLQEQGSRVKNSLTKKEIVMFNQQIEDYVKSFGTLWDNICRPEHSIIDEELLVNEHNHQTIIPRLCDFFVHRLNSLTAYVSNHILNLGFDYEANMIEISFTVPTN